MSVGMTAMLAPERVYLVVISPSGATMAARYIDFSRINTFLDGMEADTCLVYDAPPSTGGTVLRTLRPDRRSHQWT
jgi:hypothetical protein